MNPRGLLDHNTRLPWPLPTPAMQRGNWSFSVPPLFLSSHRRWHLCPTLALCWTNVGSTSTSTLVQHRASVAPSTFHFLESAIKVSVPLQLSMPIFSCGASLASFRAFDLFNGGTETHNAIIYECVLCVTHIALLRSVVAEFKSSLPDQPLICSFVGYAVAQRVSVETSRLLLHWHCD